MIGLGFLDRQSIELFKARETNKDQHQTSHAFFVECEDLCTSRGRQSNQPSKIVREM